MVVWRRGGCRTGERELDADGEAIALQRDHQGFAAHAAEQAQRIDGAFGEQRRAAGDGGADLGEVEAGGEVIAVAEHEAAADLGVVVAAGQGLGEAAKHGEVEGVALVGAVEADMQDVITELGGDARGGRHG